MKKNYLAVLATVLLFAGNSYAQSIRNCGTMPHLHEQEVNDPAITARMENIERETQQWVEQYENSANKSSVVVTIPVVMHIVYNTASQNISDAQINSQIAILNEDFRKLNADVALVPSVFSGLAADCEIQFCLAQRDPAGNATNGIVRKSTTVSSFSSNDNIKRNANGGDDAWDASKYLNIWVGNLSGGLLGYAQFPGGAAATDGVVILYTACGNTGVAAAPFNKGRTATHEIGHWLNLRHIWGDATCGNDQVADTPTQQTSNFGCPNFPHVTCSNGPNGDMWMNYMDYTDDACMYMFSAGQKSRMLASLNTTRVSLLTSLGCVPPTANCGTPSGLIATNISSSGATLNWSAVPGAISYAVQYRISGSLIWSTINSATNSVPVSGLNSAENYEFQVQAVCNGASGSFSPLGQFSTASLACTDIYEPNNSKSKSKVIPLDVDISAKIRSATDIDFFTFTTVSGATNVKVVLDQLPANYSLKLFNGNGTLINSSVNGGLNPETIIYNTNNAATYKVKVYPVNGAFSNSNCYRLRVNTSSSNFRDSHAGGNAESTFSIPQTEGLAGINLFPNPASDVIQLNFFNTSDAPLFATVVDMLGRTIFTTTVSTSEGFNTATIGTSAFNNGIYFLRLTQNDQVEVRKFIIRH